MRSTNPVATEFGIFVCSVWCVFLFYKGDSMVTCVCLRQLQLCLQCVSWECLCGFIGGDLCILSVLHGVYDYGGVYCCLCLVL